MDLQVKIDKLQDKDVFTRTVLKFLNALSLHWAGGGVLRVCNNCNHINSSCLR